MELFDPGKPVGFEIIDRAGITPVSPEEFTGPRRGAMCRCSLVPELPMGRYYTPEEYEAVATHLAHTGLEANGYSPEQVEEIMAHRAAAKASTTQGSSPR